MQPDAIIKLFEVFVDDLTELSSAEEYQILDKAQRQICNDREWEFLRKTASVATTTTTSAPMPSDFAGFMRNFVENTYNNIPEKAVVWVGGIAYEIIPMGARYQYQNGNYAYADIVGQKIVLTTAVNIGTILTFDYKMIPPEITSNSVALVIPSQFHKYIPQVMALDDDIIQKMDKARSNQVANTNAYRLLIRDLAHYNARFLNI